MTKKEARAFALKERKNEDKVMASKLVLEAIIKSKILEQYKNVGIYYPLGQEIDIMPLVQHYSNISFYLPITKEDINFVKYNSNDPLIDGPFHTKEPIGEMVLRDTIEAFIIPCVGISDTNQRIGYGKGYYDRYLSGYKGLKIGICYKSAAALNAKCDEFDVVLDKIFLG